mmetsp:Transcript_10456/g.29743  ORF Transcript_10456/g.29743 Transcript_10456/m.29743 type:complete len:204 (+) Transcript_10456:670-1281(+)
MAAFRAACAVDSSSSVFASSVLYRSRCEETILSKSSALSPPAGEGDCAPAPLTILSRAPDAAWEGPLDDARSRSSSRLITSDSFCFRSLRASSSSSLRCWCCSCRSASWRLSDVTSSASFLFRSWSQLWIMPLSAVAAPSSAIHPSACISLSTRDASATTCLRRASTSSGSHRRSTSLARAAALDSACRSPIRASSTISSASA